jgi:predicted RNA-binding Zn-ribbon protein involved in translation (DUF1610 family)
VGAVTITVVPKDDPAAVPDRGKPFSCPNCGAEYIVQVADGETRPAVMHFSFECVAAGCQTDKGKPYKAGVGLA